MRLAAGVAMLLVTVTFTGTASAACKGKTIKGTAKADVLKGTCGNDRILGLGGNDRISGGGGNDKIVGGAGKDRIAGGAGRDTISGGAGNDRIAGNAGKDTLTGGTGNDTLDGGADDDSVAGDAGADKVAGGAANDTVKGGAGNDTLDGGLGNDAVSGDAGNDSATGGDGNDSFVAGDGNDKLDGQGGADLLRVAGTSANETWFLASNGGRLALTHDAAAMADGTGIEAFALDVGGGTDSVSFGTPAPAGLANIDLQLGNDAAANVVVIDGSSGADTLSAAPSGTNVQVTGTGATINMAGAQASDQLRLEGVDGNDTLSAGALSGVIGVAIDGGEGDDTLTGGNGAETITGGGGNDTVNSGPGDDTVLLGLGDDTFASNPGDGNDTVDGEDGTDTLRANGGTDADRLTATPNGSRVSVTRNDAPAVNGGTLERLSVSAGGGADAVSFDDLSPAGITAADIDTGSGDGAADSVTVNGTAANETLAAVVDGGLVKVTGLPVVPAITGSEAANDRLTVNGAGGDDKLSGGTTASSIKLTLAGGDGADELNGGDGADSLSGGPGDDLITWDPGDGNDTIDAGDGADTMQFNGSVAGEIMSEGADAGHVKLTRNVDNAQLDVDNVETLNVALLDGADAFSLNALGGTDLTTVNVDLGVNGAGDAAADQVNVSGTSGPDVVQAVAIAGVVQVNGLGAQLNVAHPEAANDRLTVATAGDNDAVSGGVGLAALTRLTLDGGDGNDTINGGNGADVLIGGNGNDVIDGNGGNDTAFMGNDTDTFVWDPGDGSDVVEGQAGSDTLLFNGSAGAEIMAASSNGGRLLFTRNVGNIVMDVDDVEVLSVNTLGGIDTVTVNDLGPTDVTNVNLNLGVNGAGDAAVDAVTVNGTVNVDSFLVSGGAGSVLVDGSQTDIALSNSEAANDTLTINTSTGNDFVGASGLAASSTQLTVNGGNDNDVIVGSDGNDTLNGDAGDDYINGGNGADTINGGAGTNDVADGGPGVDSAINAETTINVP